MRLLSHIVSYVYHPVFAIFYMLVIFLIMNTYSFALQEERGAGILLISVFSLTVLFPILSTFMLRALGLINSIDLKLKSDRVAPLASTGVFYLWLFFNIKSNPGIDPAFVSFVLGSVISIFAALALNAFKRISLHAMGVGGMFMGILLSRILLSYPTFMVDAFGHTWVVNNIIFVYLLIISAGIVGTARLLLRAHRPSEVYWGYGIGMLGQLIALRFIIL